VTAKALLSKVGSVTSGYEIRYQLRLRMQQEAITHIFCTAEHWLCGDIFHNIGNSLNLYSTTHKHTDIIHHSTQLTRRLLCCAVINTHTHSYTHTHTEQISQLLCRFLTFIKPFIKYTKSMQLRYLVNMYGQTWCQQTSAKKNSLLSVRSES